MGGVMRRRPQAAWCKLVYFGEAAVGETEEHRQLQQQQQQQYQWMRRGVQSPVTTATNHCITQRRADWFGRRISLAPAFSCGCFLSAVLSVITINSDVQPRANTNEFVATPEAARVDDCCPTGSRKRPEVGKLPRRRTGSQFVRVMTNRF